MEPIFVLDRSAMESLNLQLDISPEIFESLDTLASNGSLLFCDEVRDDCKKALKNERITFWAIPAARAFKGRATVSFEDCQKVLLIAPDILDESPDGLSEEAQALKTVSLAYRLSLEGTHELFVVSDEEISLEERCTVSEACEALSLRPLNTDSFIEIVNKSQAA